MNRFFKQDKVVLDKKTGLMWPIDASLYKFPMTWNEALNSIRESNRSELFGYTDWKLPNRKELFSLMSHDAVNPSLPHEHPFINVFTGYYWTSTSCARLPKQAWYIHLGGARVFKGIKQNSYMVWPVRVDSVNSKIFQTGQKCCYNENGDIIKCSNTGQDGEFQSGLSYDKPRFIENTNSIYDNATDLTWFKSGNFSNDVLNWPLAFEFVEKMNKELKYGHNDWRLPTIVELESLTDMNNHSPALSIDHRFIDVQEFYWSSTTSMYDTQYAWVLYMQDGAVGVGYKQLCEFYLWPVRKKRS